MPGSSMKRSRINFFKLIQYGMASSRLFQKNTPAPAPLKDEPSPVR